MSCTTPIQGWLTPGGVVFQQLKRHDIKHEINLPCGMCMPCRIKKAADWELRLTHESKLHEESCFLTLTYSDENLPAVGLNYPDVQKFLKRVRKKYKIRHYTVGEYGDITARPHYHMCLFGKNFTNRKPAGRSESGEIYYNDPELDKLWPHGHATVQDLTPNSAGYAARYVTKKLLGEEAKQYAYAGVTPEHSHMSLKPAIGFKWAEAHYKDFYIHDFAIHKGKKRPVPSAYDTIAKTRDPANLEQLKENRAARATTQLADNTEARRKVKDTVLRATIKHSRNLK
ncbi:MAG: replication initiator protein [Microvirus sp.]|nr:MAG: replication initiator protein [Microvirus sp.]